MPNLLHEFWRGGFDGEFGRVCAETDENRRKNFPEIQFVFEVWASSSNEARRLYEQQAYGEFGKVYDPRWNIVYSDADEVEQQAYLRIRGDVR